MIRQLIFFLKKKTNFLKIVKKKKKKNLTGTGVGGIGVGFGVGYYIFRVYFNCEEKF